MEPIVTFTNAFTYLDDFVFFAAAGDEYENFAPFTRIFQYSNDPTPRWWHGDKNWRVSSFSHFFSCEEKLDCVVALSEEGNLSFYSDVLQNSELILGAGVYNESAGGWGYLSDLQQIGGHLYATGYAGQVYKRLGPDHWIHFDDGVLQQSGMQGGQYSVQVINGAHENAIYIAGCINAPYYPARASFWNGSTWQDLKLPDVAERITNLYIESESRIWMCGSNGTLLLGNASEGFKSLSTVDDNQLFLSICKFQNMLYLGSNMGLFVYDPNEQTNGIKKVVTGMTPELQDANIVDHVDKMLWSIGPKDIARFDGFKWERIHHPDNPQI